MTFNFESLDRVFVVAEIGNNHEGNFDLAMEMIEVAATTGVDAVKFQTFIPEYFVSSADPIRLERLNKFKLSYDQFRLLSNRAKDLNLIFFSTPLDIQSAIFLNEIQPIFKISSGDNNFYQLIRAIASFNKSTIISTGLLDIEEIKDIVDFWEGEGGQRKNLSLMHCVSSYPVPDEQANLAAIWSLRKNFPDLMIGYSDHTLGIIAPTLAVAAGAGIIEKHFTLNKIQSDFRDHQLSADPEELGHLVAKIKEISKLMGNGVKGMQPCERGMVGAMRRSIAASRDLQPGDLLCEQDITWLRPGTGIAIDLDSEVIGKKLLKSIKMGELIEKKNLS